MSDVLWDRPIQFKNGEPCTLVETMVDGRRLIHRTGVIGQTAHWTTPPDGQMQPGTLGDRLGFSIINPAPAGSPAPQE